ncbi:inactive peptidyl-prolyl cis-trans isomerase FKBP6-like isoform X1 [Cimex lectularius]|uniref:peptidylprolyl isomerase n=2 Tax=Cimex lectularius TaxID=79782 RepID=A0A8I6RM39_CIMLE|nr:inactive peptidyl-prolyl cis-trans isomerase FKBP6-like isoform X1 [Cimex lectularius]
MDKDLLDDMENLGVNSKLDDGFSLSDLMAGTEFTLNANEEEDSEECRMEKCFEYNEFAPYINLDCIQVDSQGGNKSPFEILSQQMTNVTDDGKVKKKILRQGTVQLPPNAAVYIQYNSYLELEEVPFDSSYLRSKHPFRLQLGLQVVYEGFELSICTMKKGEKSQFLIDHTYAFGKMGAPPRIPPCATILVEIELINFVDCGNVYVDENLSINEKSKFEHAYSKAKSYHALGNDYFSNKNFNAAVENYKKAERLLINCKMSSDDEENRQSHLLLKLYVNLMVCYNTPKINIPEKVCICAREAFQSAPKEASKNAKLFFNLGKAQMSLQEFNKATKSFKKALGLAPNCKEINDSLLILEEKQKKYYQFEKISYKKALGLEKSVENTEKEPDKKEMCEVKDESVEPEFENLTREVVKDFVRGPHSKMTLPSGLTYAERAVCESVAAEHGLSVQDEIVGGIQALHLLK